MRGNTFHDFTSTQGILAAAKASSFFRLTTCVCQTSMTSGREPTPSMCSAQCPAGLTRLLESWLVTPAPSDRGTGLRGGYDGPQPVGKLPAP